MNYVSLWKYLAQQTMGEFMIEMNIYLQKDVLNFYIFLTNLFIND